MFPARHLMHLALLGFAAAWSVGAGAQQIFRIVGPDGKVTFSDRPPEDTKARATLAPTVGVQGAGSASLPFELRGVVQRFPVTLYAAPNCSACATARGFLGSRGIPFNERTVGSNEDIEALQRLSGSATVPFATIGSQQLKGFSEAEWGQFLDAAGYPKNSVLPAGYRNPPPAPLVAAQAPRTPAEPPRAAQAPQPQAPAEPPPNPADNPAGIRF